MAGWNGSGIFTRTHVWVDDLNNNIPIQADRHDTNDTDFVNGINNCITKDGQNSPSANLPMATYKHTNVGNASELNQYSTATQIINNSLTYYTASGTDTYTLTPVPAITAYAAGQKFIVKFTNANTGAATININTLGAKALQKQGSAVESGDILASDILEILYDGTQFQIVTPLRSSTPVGSLLFGYSSVAPSGYLVENGDTIGSAASGADNASDNYETLYAYYWNNISDTYAPVSGGRGASAAADFAADKTMTMPDNANRTPYGVGTIAAGATGGAATVSSSGSISGSTGSHSLTGSEIPTHKHSISGQGGTIASAGTDPGTSSIIWDGTAGTGQNTNSSLISAGTGSGHSHGAGSLTFSGSATSVLHPVRGVYWYIKY